MKPSTLSATAIKAFEQCEAMFKAQYVDRIREPSGAAADLGTAVHDTAQTWVEGGADEDLKLLYDDFADRAVKYGLDATMVKDGRAMLKKFFEEWMESPPYVVLSTEVKESFDIKSSDGHVFQVNYIWDRGDQWEDGSIEVVDYKTWRAYYDADTMRQLLQVRIYALSAAIKYKVKNPPAIWVTYDQMRHGKVSVKFTRDDNQATWRYLKLVADRIIASDGTSETVGDGCRYCIRRAGCETLNKAIQTGNIQRYLSDDELAATRLAELKAVKGAMDDTISELESFMGEMLERLKVPERRFENGVVVKMTVRKNRTPQVERIRQIIGPEIMAKYGKIGISDIDHLLAGDELSDEQKKEVSKCIVNGASVKASASFPKK